MRTSTILKLAEFSRKQDRYQHPFRYKLSRWLVKHFCSPQQLEAAGFGCRVVPYDAGLILVDPRSYIDHVILFRGYFEPDVSMVLKRLVRPGDVCLDIGANIGVHTLVVAFAAGPTGRVIAVEPEPRTVEHLKTNLALNRLSQVQVVPAALTRDDGEIEFFSYDEQAATRGLSGRLPTRGAERAIRVPAVSPATLVQTTHLTRLDLVKIDIEGAELEVLELLGDLIQRHHPCLVIECVKENWQRFGASPDRALSLLRTWGYDIYAMADGIQPLAEHCPDDANLLCLPRHQHRPPVAG